MNNSRAFYEYGCQSSDSWPKERPRETNDPSSKMVAKVVIQLVPARFGIRCPFRDTVLIAAAFCMYNRYVDGLDFWQPRDSGMYAQMGQHLAEQGYLKSSR